MKSAGGSPVIQLLQNLINDSQKIQAEATAEENKNWADYSDYVNEFNSSMAAMQESSASKTEEKSTAESDLADQKSMQASLAAEAEELHNENTAIHGSCD